MREINLDCSSRVFSFFFLYVFANYEIGDHPLRVIDEVTREIISVRNMISGEIEPPPIHQLVICFSLSVAFGIKLHRINSRQAAKTFASLSHIFHSLPFG